MSFDRRSTAAIFAEIRQGRLGADIRDHPEFQRRVAAGMDPDTPVHLCGWVDDWSSRRTLAATFAPPLAQAAPHLMGDAQDVLLYKAWKEVLGNYPNYVAQEIGDCTSFGSSHANDLNQCVEIFGGEATEFREICTEAVYGMGREVAGMLGSGDGCYGVAVAKALTTMGSITREKVGPYSGSRAKSWGGRSGVPAEIKTAAAQYKVGKAALITTLDELDASLANLYASAGGFSQGFTMHRDADGVCKQSGSWGHETCFVGRRTKNGRRQYCMAQSWGNNVPDGPLSDDQPNFTFWIDEQAAASILGQQDWLVFSGAPDFVKRDVPAAFKHSSMVA